MPRAKPKAKKEEPKAEVNDELEHNEEVAAADAGSSTTEKNQML